MTVDSGEHIIEEDVFRGRIDRSSETDSSLLSSAEHSSPFSNFGTIAQLELPQIWIEGARLEHGAVPLLVVAVTEKDVVAD